MSDRHQELELPAPPERAREIVKQTIDELGWKLAGEQDGEIVARERGLVAGARWPLAIRVLIADGNRSGASSLALWGRIGGFGPFIAEALRDQMDAFVLALRRNLDASGAAAT